MTSRNFLGSAAVANSSVSDSSPFLAGLSFRSTSTVWLTDYRYYIADGGQPVTPQRFGMWQIFGSDAQLANFARVAEADALSGTLAAGWNEGIKPSAPVALGANVEYQLTTGFTGNFIDAQNEFTTGGPYASGITAGPSFAFASGGDPFSNPQGWFSSTLGADPRANPAAGGFNASNFGIDANLSDAYPVGLPVRVWPAQPNPVNNVNDTADNFTLGTEVWLSSQFRSYQLLSVGYYSPTGVTQLATECGVWAVQGQSLITATHQSSPSWKTAAGGAASAGGGWVYANYTSTFLSPGKYKVTVFNGAGSPAVWNATSLPYWESPGAGANGITVGPLSAPNDATASSPGQSTYHQGPSFTWPDTHAPGIGSATYWVDMLVQPVVSGAGLMIASGIV